MHDARMTTVRWRRWSVYKKHLTDEILQVPSIQHLLLEHEIHVLVKGGRHLDIIVALTDAFDHLAEFFLRLVIYTMVETIVPGPKDKKAACHGDDFVFVPNDSMRIARMGGKLGAQPFKIN